MDTAVWEMSLLAASGCSRIPRSFEKGVGMKADIPFRFDNWGLQLTEFCDDFIEFGMKANVSIWSV